METRDRSKIGKERWEGEGEGRGGGTMACTLVPLEDSVCALCFVIPSYESNVTGLRLMILGIKSLL